MAGSRIGSQRSRTASSRIQQDTLLASGGPRRRFGTAAFFSLSVGSGERGRAKAAEHFAVRSRCAADVARDRSCRTGEQHHERKRHDAGVAGSEGAGRAPDRARGYRGSLAGDAGHRGADRTRRCGVARGVALSHERRNAARETKAAGQGATGTRVRLFRPGHGQDGCVRTELFERYRSHRAVRSGSLRIAARRRGRCRACAADARVGEAPSGAHARRLRVPRRFAAAPRSGLHPDRALDLERARLLRAPRSELGTLGDDQGAALRGRYRRR